MKAGLSHICLMFLTHTPVVHTCAPPSDQKTVKSKKQYLAPWEGSHTHTRKLRPVGGRKRAGAPRAEELEAREFKEEDII